jgi:hypothetical protein
MLDYVVITPRSFVPPFFRWEPATTCRLTAYKQRLEVYRLKHRQVVITPVTAQPSRGIFKKKRRGGF